MTKVIRKKAKNGNDIIVALINTYFNPKKSNPSWGASLKDDAERRKRFFGIKPYIHYHGIVDGARKIAHKFLLVLPQNYQLRWNKK